MKRKFDEGLEEGQLVKMRYVGLKLRYVDLEALPKLKGHYDLEKWTHIALFIRNQKVNIEPEHMEVGEDLYEYQTMQNAIVRISEIIKPILSLKDFLHRFDVNSKIIGNYRNSELDYVIYFGRENKNFRIYRRLAENNVDFRKFYYCFDSQIGNQIFRNYKKVKYSDMDYVVYIRHGSRLKGINNLFEDEFTEYSKGSFNYFEIRRFFKSNKYDKYIHNDGEEIVELVDNIFLHGGAVMVYAYDTEDPHRYAMDRQSEVEKKIKLMELPDSPERKAKLYKLGFENDYKNLERMEIFRRSVYHLPRSIRYMSLDIHNKMGNPLYQLYMNNGVMMMPGMLSIFYTGKN